MKFIVSFLLLVSSLSALATTYECTISAQPEAPVFSSSSASWLHNQEVVIVADGKDQTIKFKDDVLKNSGMVAKVTTFKFKQGFHDEKLKVLNGYNIINMDFYSDLSVYNPQDRDVMASGSISISEAPTSKGFSARTEFFKDSLHGNIDRLLHVLCSKK